MEVSPMNTASKKVEEGWGVCEFCGAKYKLLKTPDGRYLDLNHGACPKPACMQKSRRKHL